MSSMLASERKDFDSLVKMLASPRSLLDESALVELLGKLISPVRTPAARTATADLLVAFCNKWGAETSAGYWADLAWDYCRSNMRSMRILHVLHTWLIQLLRYTEPSRIAEASPFAQRILAYQLLLVCSDNKRDGTKLTLAEVDPVTYLNAGVSLFYAGGDLAQAKKYLRTGLRQGDGKTGQVGALEARAVLVKVLRAQGKDEAAKKQEDELVDFLDGRMFGKAADMRLILLGPGELSNTITDRLGLTNGGNAGGARVPSSGQARAQASHACANCANLGAGGQKLSKCSHKIVCKDNSNAQHVLEANVLVPGRRHHLTISDATDDWVRAVSFIVSWTAPSALQAHLTSPDTSLVKTHALVIIIDYTPTSGTTPLDVFTVRSCAARSYDYIDRMHDGSSSGRFRGQVREMIDEVVPQRRPHVYFPILILPCEEGKARWALDYMFYVAQSEEALRRVPHDPEWAAKLKAKRLGPEYY